MTSHEYRNKLETHLMDKEAEMDKTTTYMTVGLLGFFMTINDKFVPLLDSNLKLWMYFSIFFLIGSLITGLVYKYITVLFDGKIIRYIDENDIDLSDINVAVNKLWEKYIKIQNCVKFFIYLFLSFGLIAEIVFTVSNFERKSLQTNRVLKVELVNAPTDSVLSVKVIDDIHSKPEINKKNEKHQK